MGSTRFLYTSKSAQSSLGVRGEMTSGLSGTAASLSASVLQALTETISKLVQRILYHSEFNFIVIPFDDKNGAGLYLSCETAYHRNAVLLIKKHGFIRFF